MLSVNLLPAQQKSAASRRQAKVIASTVTYILAAVLFLFTGFLYYTTNISQKNKIEDLITSTDTAIIKLQGEPEIDKLLTIQNQLTAIPQLHNSKAAPSRLFDYLDKIVPADVTLTDVTIGFAGDGGAAAGGGAEGATPGLEDPLVDDLVFNAEDIEIVFAQSSSDATNQIMINGITRDFKSLNTFVDILKNAEFVAKSDVDLDTGEGEIESDKKKAFTRVNTNSAAPQDQVTLSFSLTFDYDPQLFDFTVNQIVFSVPSKITTVSEQERPTGLFIDDPFDDVDAVEQGGAL